MDTDDEHDTATAAWLQNAAIMNNSSENTGWSSGSDDNLHYYFDESSDAASSSGASTHDTLDDTHDHPDDWRVGLPHCSDILCFQIVVPVQP